MSPDDMTSGYTRNLDEFEAWARQRGRKLARRRRLLTLHAPIAALVLAVGIAALVVRGGGGPTERVNTDRGRSGTGAPQLPVQVDSHVPAGPSQVRKLIGLPVQPARRAPGAPVAAPGAPPAALRRLTNGFVAFSRGGPNAGSLDTADINVVKADGTALRDLTGQSAFMNTQPSWSPDGTRIAFSSDRDNPQRGNHTHFDLYAMNADGSGVVRLTTSSPQGNGASFPSWSPDGKHMLFAADLDNGNSALFVMRADGSGVARLTSDGDVALGVQETYPAWSPDGARIAFIRHPSSGPTQLMLMNADGTHRVALASAFGEPAWSPDGTRIAIHVEDGAAKKSEIAIINVDGSGMRTLVSVPEPAVATDPAWAPDGATLAYTRDPDGPLSIDPDPTSPHATGGRQPASIHIIGVDGANDHVLVATPVDNNDDAADFG